MKKILLLVLSLLMVIMLAACSSTSDNAESTAASESTEATAAAEDGSSADSTESVEIASEDAHNHEGYSDSKVDISEASVTEAEATDMIKALSMEQLGLEGEKDDYKFMVATVGKVIDGADYIQVIAAVVGEESEDGTVSIETKGTYYISYDGEKILVENSETGELTEIEK